MSRRRLLVTLAMVAFVRVTMAGVGAPRSGIADRICLLAAGAVILYALLTRIDRRTVRPATTMLDELAKRRPARPARPARLTALEELAAFGADRAQGEHYHLRPYLRELLRDRFAMRGIDLDTDPQAPDLLGDRAWELLRPDRPPPDEPRRSGASPASIRALATLLARLR
jgi:hypothetical protein